MTAWTGSNSAEEIARLRRRLAEAEQTLSALRRGEADALVVEGENGPQVYTLKSAAEPYRMLVEQMREGALTLSKQGVILYCNEAFARVVGADLAHLTSSSALTFIAEEDFRRLAEPGGSQGWECCLKRKDGSEAPVFLSSAALKPDGKEFISIVVTDLSRQQLRQRYEAIVESIAQAVYLLSPGLVIKSWNPGAVQLYGHAAAGIIGKREHDLCPDNEACLDLEDFKREVIRRRAGLTRDARRCRKDGSVLDVIFSLAPLYDEEGQLTGFSASTQDVSARKNAEAQLSADLAALTQLHVLSARPLQADGLAPLLQGVMDAGVAIAGADHGTLQLLEGGTLRIVAHHGHQPAFLEYFADAGTREPVCGAALLRGERVVVPDVEKSDLFADTPSLAVLRAAGVRAVQSTPMVTREGKLVGVLTTQWSRPHRPDQHDLWRTDLLSRQASDLIENIRAAEALRESEERERARRHELETILSAIPAAVFIAEDAACARMTTNPAARKILRLPEGANASKSAPGSEAPANFEAFSADGKPLKPEELPMQRAAASGRAVEGAEFEARFVDGGHTYLFGNALPLFSSPGVVRGAVGAFLDITDRKRAEGQVRLLMREVTHRSKNMLMLVQAIARQTAGTDREDFIIRFSERLQALAASQDLLVKSAWRGVDLEELVRTQLAHFKDAIGTRIEVHGPRLSITAQAAQTLGMALHELATNAGKYGALSNASGRVQIVWDLEAGQERAFTISWSEEAGPPVTPPSRRGFGSTVISGMAEMSLDAEVVLDYAAAGLRWRLKCPAAAVLEESLPPSLPDGERAAPSILVVEDGQPAAPEIAHMLNG